MTNVCEIEWDENCEAVVSEKEAKLLDERFEDITIVGKASKKTVKEDIPEHKEETEEKEEATTEEEDEVDKELQEKIKGLNTLPLKELQELAKEIDEKGDWQKMKKKKQLIKYIIDNS